MRLNQIVIRIAIAALLGGSPAPADSVNSPNITLNVDTNRAVGNGAGNVAVTINTITIAEISLPEYSSGDGRAITLRARPGFQFDPTSNVTIQSATIGFNGAAINTAAVLTPAGIAEETLTFNLTSGTNASVQDIIRINGIRLKILNATGAAGPAQTTMSVTTSTAGGAFTNQGIVAANITRGAADRLVFSVQPGDTQAGDDLLPAVRIVDFGGNVVTNDDRTITLALGANLPGAALLGVTARLTSSGVATWAAGDDLRLLIASGGYTLRATHSGAAFLTSDTIDSAPFEIAAGVPDHLVYTVQPADTSAGSPILVTVTVQDALNNTQTTAAVEVTLDAAGGITPWPLLVDSSLTKTTFNGVATWDAVDRLRVNAVVTDYKLIASGTGAPVESNPFDVSAGAPSAVRFVTQPSDTTESAPIEPAVQVEIVDAFGNRTDSDAAVSLVLGSGCAADLDGDLATAADGLATFEALEVGGACDEAVLEAISGDLTRASSDTFAVTVGADPNDDPNDDPNATPDPNDNDVPQCGGCGAGAPVALVALLALRFAPPLRRSRR